MAKKRKLKAGPSQIEEEEEIVAEEEDIGDDDEDEIEYEEVEYEEEEEEEEYEEEEEEEADAEVDDPHNSSSVGEKPILSNDVGVDASTIPSNNDGRGKTPVQSNNNGDEVEEEPIHSVLAAFSKEKLVELLAEAAHRHADVAARVRADADADPSNRKIFVHSLNWDTAEETLFEEFAKYGEIEDCRLVTDKITGQSKGYGFVLFKTCRAARQALKEPQKLIDRRMTSSQLASVGPIAAGSPLPRKLQQPMPGYTQRKIFVTNVGEELDPEKLKDFFSKYGEIEEGPLGLDRETGKPKGFCLFTYKTVESAKLALSEPHKQFEGVTLHCQHAIDGPKPHKGAAKNLQYVDNVASNMVDSAMVPPYMQLPQPHMVQQPPPVNMDPAAFGQALTTLLAAQGGGLNLLGVLGAATGMYNNSAVVPGFGGPVVQGGYGMGGGVNMGSNGMEGGWNQGGRGRPANQMRWRGRGRGKHGPRRPRMGQ
ncbi:UBP1-associated protein 2A-like [Salvia miltiorrhiza]|uniref:UBP1-associated protein 2A-like n=1 Tax=Salvia miltiorrhiza TaxID=226208 RepID=UPI0025ACAC83|nr:UBP1-associated protein 2A-like [Salvia miltiorrhiza]